MTIEEYNNIIANIEQYKINDLEYKCPICEKLFLKNGIKQHILKQHYNKDNGIKNSGGYNGHYSTKKFKEQMRNSAIKVNTKLFGEKKEWVVKCAKCGKEFTVIMHERTFLKRSKFYCSSQCSHSRLHSEADRLHLSNKLKQTLAQIKKDDPDRYFRITGFHNKNNNSKYFTSKNERLIRDYIIKTFPCDGWTFGGVLKVENKFNISRDLYSNKMKICFEYDGIWHFEDIHNQLKHKQEVDLALEKWCATTGYRLVRISESWWLENKKDLNLIIDLLYNRCDQIIKCGREYYL